MRWPENAVKMVMGFVFFEPLHKMCCKVYALTLIIKKIAKVLPALAIY